MLFRLWARGATRRELAAMYGVNRKTVREAVRGALHAQLAAAEQALDARRA